MIIDLSDTVAKAQLAFALGLIAFLLAWKFFGRIPERKPQKTS
jgi:hypothetical protein